MFRRSVAKIANLAKRKRSCWAVLGWNKKAMIIGFFAFVLVVGLLLAAEIV